MKKALKNICFLCLCLILAGAWLGAQEARAVSEVAYGSIPDNNINWRLWDDGELVFSVAYDTGEASIPSMSHDSTSEWLAYKSQIKTITINHYNNTNITSIGSHAFAGCANLTAVDIPSGTVTSIGSYAFSGCTKLSSLNFSGTSLTSIGSYAFQNCTGLTSLTLTDNITSVDGTAFYGADSLRVYVPTPKGSAARAVSNAGRYYVTGDNAFALRYESGHYVLRAYTGTAASVTVPSHVDVLGYQAFKGNTTLTSVTVPASVTSMETHVFDGCTGLTTVTLSEGLTGISSYAFTGCSGLTAINIPNSVTSIGSYAFYNCTSLTSLTLTDNITSVDSTAFYGASSLRVYVPTPKGSAAQAVSSAGTYYVIGDDAFALRYESNSYVLRAYTGEAASVTVPSYVDVLGYQAFMDNTTITSVTLPTSV
ncbi:MAG: leucine-rich repeat domain-containing protein, partial [Clostridia bacterium]|nr:leucine-rich repeat domain-containing protein [Clostridia bacterium]